MAEPRFLQDFERANLNALEEFLAEQEFNCPPGSEANDIRLDITIEEDEIIVEVGGCPPMEEDIVFPEFE